MWYLYQRDTHLLLVGLHYCNHEPELHEPYPAVWYLLKWQQLSFLISCLVIVLTLRTCQWTWSWWEHTTICACYEAINPLFFSSVVLGAFRATIPSSKCAVATMDPGKLRAWRKGFLATLTDYCTFGSHLNRKGDHLVGHFRSTGQERELLETWRDLKLFRKK